MNTGALILNSTADLLTNLADITPNSPLNRHAHLVPVAAGIFVLCYMLGSIPFGLLASQMAGVDIRKHGSGNIGATNVWRVLGRKWGLPVFLLDVGKGLFAAILGKWLADRWLVTLQLPHLHTDTLKLDLATGGIIGGVASIIGHNFPIWLRFKGGKGVATSLGVLFGLMPLASTIVFAIWGLTVKISKYVSLASIVAALALPLVVLVLLLTPQNLGGMTGWAYFYFTLFASGSLILRHISNIKRLLNGTERKIGEPKLADGELDGEVEESGEADGAARGESTSVPEPPETSAQSAQKSADPNVIDAKWTRVDDDAKKAGE